MSMDNGGDVVLQKLSELQDRIAELEHIATSFQFWARRYADNRATYAVDEVNTLTAQMLDMNILVDIDKDTIWARDQHLTEPHMKYVEKYGEKGDKLKTKYYPGQFEDGEFGGTDF